MTEKYQIHEVVTIQNGGREKEAVGLQDDMHAIKECTVDLKISEELLDLKTSDELLLMELGGEASSTPVSTVRHAYDYEPELCLTDELALEKYSFSSDTELVICVYFIFLKCNCDKYF